MAGLQKQPIEINFGQGLDTKTDPHQVKLGKFLTLVNSVFNTTGRLTKRNGYKNVTALPNTEQTVLTTLNDNLISTGSNLLAFSKDTSQWLDKGVVQPVQLDVQPLVRVSTSQTMADTVISDSGLALCAYMDGGLSYYQITDSTTGQQIVSRKALPATAVNPRTFILGVYFIVTFIDTVSTTPTLQYIAIPTAAPDPAVVTPRTISADVLSLSSGYNALVTNNTLFIAWGGSASTMNIAYVDNQLVVSPTVQTISDTTLTLISINTEGDIPDLSPPAIWVTYWDSITKDAYTTVFDFTLTSLMAPTKVIAATDVATITSSILDATGTKDSLQIFYQNINNYSYNDSTANAMRSDLISTVTVNSPVSGTGAGTISSTTVVIRSVGLASRSFKDNTGTIYFLVVYGPKSNINPLDDSNQSTYFLIDSEGTIYMRLAYSNAGGYMTTQVLPSVSSFEDNFYIPYRVTDFLATVNKVPNGTTGIPAKANAIYTQTGINLAKFSLNIEGQQSSEIAGALHLTGGQLWEYDGVRPVEHSFHVWPENVVATTSTGSGSIAAGTYNYVFTYEWTDNQGMLHRSAPSIPFTIVTTTASSTNTIKVPTLRLTDKIAPNPVRIVGYRWSVAQQTYFQFTSLTSPTANSTTTDSVSFTDTLADSSILGNTILYTTGGVIENIAAPASIDSALFSNRLFLIDAEDRNLLWFSKQVIESVPVEMSDLLTLFIAPTTGAQGSTGPMTALSAMDDKLIIFKRDAIYYITGAGPDNTGANSSFSDPVFITSTVGCNNPDSVVLMPDGLMFQSDKGVWLLGRDLNTSYIGADVEAFNTERVLSAEALPGTNQILFVLGNNQTMMYDYFFKQWATHTNIKAISATLYQGEHTYLNSLGQVFQQTPGLYLDGSVPVLMNLKSSWINVAGLQGYERFYFAFLLGTYLSPFKLNVLLAYDYNEGNSQSIIVSPGLATPNWGGEELWGSNSPWGGPGKIFEARLFPKIQKCESFQISIQEMYDASFGQTAGAGLTLSGMSLIVGVKKGYRVQSARKSFG